MNPRLRSALVPLGSVAAFVLLLVVTVRVVFPFIVTRETYADGRSVSPRFPVAVEQHGMPAIVRWGDYRKDPSRVDGHLFIGEEGKTYELSDPDGESTESFSMRQLAGQAWRVDYSTDDYDDWSEYQVVGGKPVPLAYGFTGAFATLYGFAAGLVGAWLFHRAFARRLAPKPMDVKPGG